MISIKERGR